MKVSIRRHGLVIKSIEIQGREAKIGSDPENRVHLDDPYLAAHVADIVHRGDDWYIVDAGMSIDGVLHNGARVEDEPLLPGEVYSVGAFEIVPEGFEVSPTTLEGLKQRIPDPGEAATQVTSDMMPTQAGAMPIPRSEEDNVPKTEFKTDLKELRKQAGFDRTEEKPTPKSFTFRPLTMGGNQPAPAPLQQAAPQMPVPGAQAAAPAKKAGGSGKRMLLIIAAMIVVILVLAVVMLRMRGSKAPAESAPPPVATTGTEQPSGPADLASQGDAQARTLEIEKALASWEQAINRGASAELKGRYTRTALELAKVHAAAHDSTKSRLYFEKVLQYGDPVSAEVAEAKARLAGE